MTAPATSGPALHAAILLSSEFRLFPVAGIDAAGHCTCRDGSVCKQPGKHPLRGSRGSTDATSDRTKLLGMFDRAGVEANVAIATGQGLVIIDVDVDPAKGVDGVASLEALGIEIPTTRTVRTPRGGAHLYFKVDASIDVANSQGKLGLGIDVRGRGGYVVAPPSLHARGTRYAWVDESAPIADLPGALLAVLGSSVQRTVRARRDVQITGPRRAMALERAWRALRSRGVGEAARALAAAEAEAWAVPAMTDAELEAVAARVASLEPAPERLRAVVTEGHRDQAMASFVGALVRQGFCHATVLALTERENEKRFRPPIEDPERIVRSLMRHAPAEPYYAGHEEVDAEADELGWDERLVRKPPKADGSPGALAPIAANVATVIRSHPEWRGTVAWDERAGAIRFAGEPPFAVDERRRTIDGSDRAGSAWIDSDESRVAAWCARSAGLLVGDSVARAGVRLAAESCGYDPMRDYFEALVWDRVPRLTTWLETYAHATGPETLRRGVGRMWLISAVARTYRPGCQADYMLVLEGRQGAGKSSLLRALAPDPSVFQDTPLDLGSKDALQALRGLLIVEMAELKSVRGAHSIETVKAFLTSRTDRYRDSYGRTVEAWPRRCVFAGSVNPEAGAAYLADQTGGRRFWPVPVGAVNVAALERDRDQLWAEAVAAYQDGEPWHPERGSDVERELEEAVAARTLYDENTTTVGLWLDSPAGRSALAASAPTPAGYLSATEVAMGALGASRDRIDRHVQEKVRKALHLLGWRETQLTYRGARPRVWSPLTA
jgi:hypothetical protein